MTDQTKTLQALQLSIRMEIDGKAFYLKASRESTNALGKKLLARLSSEEDRHRRTFESIYESLRRKEGWPEAVFHPDKGKTIRSIFSDAVTPGKPAASEMDAIGTALGMEQKSVDLYRERAKVTADSAEKALYEALAGEEEGHYLALIDYREYLTDPTGWFTMKERHSLDGG